MNGSSFMHGHFVCFINAVGILSLTCRTNEDGIIINSFMILLGT